MNGGWGAGAGAGGRRKAKRAHCGANDDATDDLWDGWGSGRFAIDRAAASYVHVYIGEGDGEAAAAPWRLFA